MESPYLEEAGAVWLRGNLHAHTTNSDGEGSPQEVIDRYAELGYDFLCLSDHDVLSATPGQPWGFHVCRNRYPVRGTYVWSWVGSSNHNVESFGFLEL